MQPIFTEKEEKGIYEATLSVTTDSGVSIQQRVEINIDSIKESARNKCRRLDIDDMSGEIETAVKNTKANALNELNDYFARKLNQYICK